MMMKLKKIVIILLIINGGILDESKGQSRGYTNLDSLYADFVKKIKSTDDDLKQYCYKINPDAGTVAFMEKNNISYEGVPNGLKQRNLTVSWLGDRYFQMVLNFKTRLAARGQLENLEYLGRETQEEESVNKPLNIYFTETRIKLKLGKDTIKCQLGEMMTIDGKWKVFSDPKL